MNERSLTASFPNIPNERLNYEIIIFEHLMLVEIYCLNKL